MATTFARTALLAGPIVRRADAHVIHIWLATASATRVDVVMLDAKTKAVLGRGSANTIRIGASASQLHVALVQVAGDYPMKTLLVYDVHLHGRSFRELAGGDNTPLGWGYHGGEHPTLVLRDTDPTSILHASCRKPHGHGVDALGCADAIIAENAEDLELRPSALFLTGDQIYADDVADALTSRIRKLAPLLCGVDELVRWPGYPELRRVSSIERGERGAALAGLFTSGAAGNHLVAFGEFAASYLLAWGDAAWTIWSWPDSEESRATDRDAVHKYRWLMAYVRRALANVPTYMIFDDHDVTDDWNLTPGWTFRTYEHPLTRQIILDALAAFAIFQAWGNDPDDTWSQLVEDISKWLSSGQRKPDPKLEQALLERYWGYVTPAHPATLVLDTRTHRYTLHRSPDGAPILLDPERLAKVRAALDKLSSPRIIVAPVPLIGVGVIDAAQRALTSVLGKSKVDFESWSAEALSQYSFREQLHAVAHVDRKLDACRPAIDEGPLTVVLSGDVHYSTCMSEVLLEEAPGRQPRSSRVLQFTSSASKNAWVEPKRAHDIEKIVARLTKEPEYLIYMRPVAALLAEAVDRFSVTSPTLFSPFVVPLDGEAILESIRHGAPLVVRAYNPLRSAPHNYRQAVCALDDDKGKPAFSFGSSIGWLRLRGSGDDRSLVMALVEWDSAVTSSRVGAPLSPAIHPLVRTRMVTVTKR